MVRAGGSVTLQDIENEVRAVSKVCMEEPHKNVIAVFRHGTLLESHYFIDMELCSKNLETYIKMDRFSRKWNDARTLEVLEITRDIASGISYIHEHDLVHRDIKPRNSNFRINGLLVTYSPFF